MPDHDEQPPPGGATDRDPAVNAGKSPGGADAGETSTHDASGLELANQLAARVRGGRPRPGTGKREPRTSAARLSGAHPDSRDPAPVGSVVDRIVSDSGWEREVAVHGVFGRWPSIVGDEVAAHCTPERFQDGHLTVRADSTAWATQLRLLAPTVVRRLNEELGHGTVLRIDVAGPQAPSWRRGPRSVRDGRGPRDTYG